MKEKRGRGVRERGQVYLSQDDKGLLLGREKTRPIGKWRFIKVKGKPRVRMRCLVLIGHVN